MAIFTSKTKKEKYIEFCINWKKEYKSLSAMIRSAKAARKEGVWEYRAVGDIKVQRRVRIGNNPAYDPKAAEQVRDLKVTANAMLGKLVTEKTLASKRYAEALRELAA